MPDSKNTSNEEALALFGGAVQPEANLTEQKEKSDGVSDQDVIALFQNTSPAEAQPAPSLFGTAGNTLSGGGEIIAPKQTSLVVSGPLGSGQFSTVPTGPKGKFDEYGSITNPDTRKGLAENFKNITDPRDLKELQEKVPWYDMSGNPTQVKSLFLHEWSEKTDPFELVGSAAKAGVGMLQSLPPLVVGAGRLAKDVVGGLTYDWDGDPSGLTQAKVLTEQQRKGLSEQQIRDAELSAPDKLIRASRVGGDAILEAEEQLRTAVANFAENKSMLWDKAKVGFASAPDYGDFSGLTATPETEQQAQAKRAAKTAELMEEAEKNFAARLNAKHVEYLHREKNPAVLARDIEAVWKYPSVKTFATNVMELMMPPAEDAAPGFGGDMQAAKANRRAQAAEAAEVGVQAAIAESNRLQEDPEQVGAIAMTTPANVVGLMGKIAQQAGKLTRGVSRGMQAAFYTEQELNALYSAERAAERAAAEAQARVLEQPGRLERALGNTADTFDKAKAAFAKVPVPAQYIGMAGLGGLAGAVTAEDPLVGFLEGAGTGAAGRLGMKIGGGALLAAPRLGQELIKAGRLAGAEMGRFEALERLGSASPEVAKFVNWSQKVGGGNVMDFIEKNASVFVQHNVSMLPMMVALGVLEDKDAKEFAQMWAEFATYGFIHGQVLGGILGNDPIRMRMDREANMRQAQRVVNSLSPESRENVRNLTWDRVVEQSEARVEQARAAAEAQLAADPNSPEAAEAQADYNFANQLHRQNLIAPPEARAAFEDGIRLSLAQASNLINGVLTPNSNMNIELLTTQQIYDKMIAANPNYNGVGAPLTLEQATAMNPGADGAKIGKGIADSGFTMDAAKDTVFVNLDNALAKGRLSGEAIPNVIAHEVAGHGLFAKSEYRQKIAPLYNKMFGTEAMDENGNWQQITPAQPGLSREDLLEKFFNKYLEGKTPESVAQYAEAAGVWDKANNTFNNNKVVELMREEVLAEAHAGRFYGNPESPAQRGISWLASRISGGNLKAALNHLYSVAGPAVYAQWTSGVTGATYSPEVMRAIRNVERQMKQYDGEFTDAEAGEAVAAPITKKDVLKSKEMLQKYYGDTGKFETAPVAVVTDADGKVVQSVKLTDNEAFEGSWNYQQNEATGDNVPNRESGFGDIPAELAGIEVPVGGRVQVQRQIAYDEATGKPIERKNKATVEYLKRRVQMLRDAIDNSGDQSQLGRFRAVGGREGDEDLHYTGKLTAEQRAAVAGLPESVVPASIKELLFKYDDLMSRGDGTVLDIDYASRLNDKGNYQAFSPKIRQIVPLQLHLSKAGNFYTTAWDISDLRRKVRLYEKYAKGVFEPWGGDIQKFWNDFRTILLPNLTNPDPNVPGWQGLDADPNTAKLKRTIYEKMLGAPNPNVPNVESIPDLNRGKFSRSERKLDKQSSFDQIIKSFRLDSVTAAEENANSDFKYPIPYKARFLPEQEAGGTGAQMRFQPEGKEDPTNVAPGFYSKAGRLLLGKMGGRASAEQIKGMLDPQKGSGVKPDELKWSGINQFIDATQAEKGFITKEDVNKFLTENYAAKFATQTETADVGGTQYDKYTLPGGKNYKEVVLKVPGTGYISTHFRDVFDYIAHLRTAEHGNGLLIEELQSDLHQNAREKGYKEPVPLEETLRALDENLAAAKDKRSKLFEERKRASAALREMPSTPRKELSDFDSVYAEWLDEKIANYPKEIDRINAKIEATEKEIEDYTFGRKVKTRGEIPDAPFRKDWPLQLFKYALKDAVATGKEWIGWTGGEKQAERYDLSEQVDKVSVTRGGGDKWEVWADKDGQMVAKKDADTIEEVAAFIGKDLAKKVEDMQPGAGVREFSGVDLKVGGEGMKGFYDTMLPKEIGKYVKQWGGKVEKSAVETGETSIIRTAWDQPNYEYTNNGWVSTETGEYLPIGSPESMALSAYIGIFHENQITGAAKQILRSGDILGRLKDTAPIWKIAITPEMQESVTGGQTRFMPAKLDSEYKAAFEAKDEERARGLVDNVARLSGYREVWNSGAPTQEIEGNTVRTPFMYFTDTKENADAYSGARVNRWFIKTNPMQVNEHQDQFIDFFNPKSSRFISDTEGGEDRAYKGTVRQLVDDAITEAQQAGFDSIEMPSEWEGKPWKNYIVFDPSQIKSADPFTYDNAGKLIPLSERFNMGTGDIRFMPSVAVVPERFTGTGEEEQRRGRYVEPPKFFKKFDISQYEPGGKFFDAETGEDLTNKSYENASIAVVDGKPTLVANNEAETTGTGPLFRTNLFKQKAGWKWVSEDAPDTSTIVSVEGQGKHLYALQADFQNGVKMARYENKASEPRLRPTGRGELAMGEQIGTIDIRGKQHPVYDKVTIGQAPESAQIRFMPEQPAVDEQTQQTRINEPGRKAEDIGVRSDEARNRGGQRTSRGYSPLAGAPNVYGRSGPIERISDIADRYADSRGIVVRKQAAYVEADVERGRRIAEEYAKMPHDPQNPRVQEAYADLIRQSADQYKALVEDGYKAWFIDPANDPYEGKPWKAMRDLRENESMGVFPTESGFGSGDTELVVSDNPLLGDSGLKWPYGSPDGPLRRVLWNDVFRYIHDAFGHGIEGAGFREDGEENAWQAHVRLFDGPAVGAMTSETRGQNSWLNFGPHAEKNKTASVEETVFADQKTGLMPEWTWNEGVAPDEPLLERGTLSDIRFMPAAKKKKPAKQKKGAAEEEKLSPQEKAAIKLKTAFVVDEGDSVSLPILQETANGKPKLDKNKEPKIIKLDYNLINSPEITQFSGGVVEDPSKPDWENLAYDVPAKFQKVINAAIDSGAIDDAVNRAVEKTARYLRNPEIAAGKGWYSRMRENLLAALGEEKRELLSQLLGATSAKTPVNENFLQAMDGLEGIMSGRYDSNRESYLSMLAAEEKGELNTLITEKKFVATIQSKIKQLKKEAKKLTGKKQQTAKTEISKLEELIAIPEEERTKRDRMKITVLGSGLMPLRSNGKKFNANSMAVMKVIAGTWLDNRKAPKTPNFAGNLSGRTVQATIDVWAARFLRQLLYENSGQPWRIQPKSEEGVSNEDFALGQVIMERVAKKLDMNPDDLQAVLWFAEKDNWEKQGWTKSIGAEKSSFDEIFHKFFPKDRKPLSFQEAIELFAKEKAKINEAETEEVEDGEEEDIE
jgi:hypothetical protein